MGAALACLDATATAITREDGAAAINVTVINPLAHARNSETVVLHLDDLRKLVPELEPATTVVVDASGAEISSQLVDMDGNEIADDLVFQDDFAERASKTFTLRAGKRRQPTREDYRVYGRFVRERHDDFAWENDRIAHRMYGPDLETWMREPLTSSGVDVWTKRARKLIVNDWYLTDDYHEDHGEGADLYSVGKSRGCGGLGIYLGGKLAVSRNFTASRVLANGPIRLVFELTYAPWQVGGARVSEIKRVILDAGQSFDRFESSFSTDPTGTPLLAGIGIAKHKGGVAESDPRAAWLRTWEPLTQPNGNLGCAIVVPGARAEFKVTDLDYLLVTAIPTSGTVVYFAGFGWDRSSDVADAAAWANRVENRRREAVAPLQISLALASPSRPSPAPPSVVASYAARMVETVISRAPAVLTDAWEYDTGLVLKGIERVALQSKNRELLAYVKRTMDGLIDGAGTIKGYRTGEYNIDQVNMGRLLFRLWAEAQGGDKERYRKAIETLRAQMRTQPRTGDGAFWHKKIYPHQMWLDGVYMASPFLAEYATTFPEPALFDDLAKQILLAEEHMRDPLTGLLYHGWDEQKKERWADAKTGRSPQFWGRAMGWYAMAVVDVLEWLPREHSQRQAILGVLERLASAIARVQDGATGVWWQVLDQPERSGNYREASASSMFVYALSKAVRSGWLGRAVYGKVASRGYQGLLHEFVELNANGHLDLKNICKVAGLGGNPYRDGSYAYYTSTEVVKNDPKGVGAFLLAAVENE
ncbi:MAG TPA: glycoside hydrolase family 88 protein [Polyangia bacterium]